MLEYSMLYPVSTVSRRLVFHLLPFERKVFFGYFKCLAESQSVKVLYVFRYDHHVVCGFVEDNEFPVTVIYKSTCRIYDTLEKCIAFSTFLVFVVSYLQRE